MVKNYQKLKKIYFISPKHPKKTPKIKKNNIDNNDNIDS